MVDTAFFVFVIVVLDNIHHTQFHASSSKVVTYVPNAVLHIKKID
jgi:hypothetical protein